MFMSMGCDYVFELRPPTRPIVHPPTDTWVWRTTVEWYLQGKSEDLGKESAPMPLCPPQIPYGFTRGRTHAFAVRRHRLTPVPWNGRTRTLHIFHFSGTHFLLWGKDTLCETRLNDLGLVARILYRHLPDTCLGSSHGLRDRSTRACPRVKSSFRTSDSFGKRELPYGSLYGVTEDRQRKIEEECS
jgi:hypothetical protein